MDIKINGNATVYNPLAAETVNLTQPKGTSGETPPPAEQTKESSDNPKLQDPQSSDPFTRLINYTAPSFGAAMLSLITEMNAEQRQAARDQKALQTEAQIANIKEQADVMREKAVAQLCIGIATGVLSVAQGVASTAMTAKGINSIDKSFNADGTMKPGATSVFSTRQNAETTLNTQVQAFNSSMGGVSGMMNSINQAVGGFFDAEVTELQAEQERMKAMQDSLDSLADSLKETLQKALSTQDAIQENMNQTRTKILG